MTRVDITKNIRLYIDETVERIETEYLNFHPSPYDSMEQLGVFLEWLDMRKIQHVIMINNKSYLSRKISDLVIGSSKMVKFIPARVEIVYVNFDELED